MRPYHSGNLKHQPYPHWRVKALSWVAKLLGIQFKINGFPFGANTRTTLRSMCGQFTSDNPDF